MADEKKTPAPEEPVSGKSPDAGKHDPNAPAQEETGTPERPESSPVAETPKPPEEKVPEDKSQTGVSNKDGAEVVVPIEKISELIAKRNQAAREKAEQNTPPDKAPEGKQMGLFETAPTPKHGGRPPQSCKRAKGQAAPGEKTKGQSVPRQAGQKYPGQACYWRWRCWRRSFRSKQRTDSRCGWIDGCPAPSGGGSEGRLSEIVRATPVPHLPPSPVPG